jgi:AraC family transcriptional regulator
MNEPETPEVELLAELRRPGITVQVARSMRRQAIHVIAPTNSYRLILLMTPRPANARACFPESWGPTRFEPLGDLTLLPPGHLLQIRGDRQRQATIICHLPRRAIEQWLDDEVSWTDLRLEASLHLSSTNIRSLVQRLGHEAHTPGLASDAIAEFIAGQLGIEIARFCRAISEKGPVGGVAAWRLRVIDKRLEDLSTLPTLEELANLCNISVRQLTRGFRVSRGCSIRDYCADLRIDVARRLLGGTDSIKSIAFATGFASPSTFAHAFRVATGTTPSDFRLRMHRTVGLPKAQEQAAPSEQS